MDLHTRRALHDEILPALHLAVLQLSGATQGSPVNEALQTLADTHRQIAALLTDVQSAPAARARPVQADQQPAESLSIENSHITLRKSTGMVTPRQPERVQATSRLMRSRVRSWWGQPGR